MLARLRQAETGDNKEASAESEAVKHNYWALQAIETNEHLEHVTKL